jgi:hypothetical protein
VSNEVEEKMKIVNFIALFLLAALPLFSEEEKENEKGPGCPMHLAHQAEQKHHHDVDHKGDQVMGFSHLNTTHHFYLREKGGNIEVTANDPADDASVKSIRSHLQEITGLFQSGDFSKPEAIHSQVPPGSHAMNQMRDQIDYQYEEIPAGARVVIRSNNQDAAAAVHEFLKFQIKDHRTGDPLEITQN